MLSLQRPYYLRHISLVVMVALFCGTCAKKHPSLRYGTQLVEAEKFPTLKDPVVRIGLKTESRSSVISGPGVLSYTDGSESAGIRSKLTVSMSFLTEVSARYGVQVASFSSRENAEKEQKMLRSRVSHPSFIVQNPDLHRFQVRVGPFGSKEKAQQAIEELKTSGYPNAFFVAENAGAGQIPELLVKDELGNVLLKSRRAVSLWTKDLSIEIDQVRYRGYALVFVNQTGRLTIVNVVNLEEYLKGVVPNEIGASSAAYEALKAQAVAARTYAYRNLKQFDAEGYDLCATARCQVYSGMGTENQLTSAAIEETDREIITYQGDSIHALYTSTCGGRTENAEYMFDGWNYPYLHSVECYPEEIETYKRTTQISGERIPWWLAWLSAKTGIPVAPDLTSKVTTEEVIEDMALVLRYLGKTACSPEALQHSDWIHVGAFLVNQLCWQSRRDSLLNEKDYQYFLSHLDFSINESPDAHSFLLLFHDGILMPEDLYRFNPYQSMTRADFLRGLYEILDHYHQLNAKKGEIREVSTQEIQILDDLGVHSYGYSDPIYLFQKVGETLTPRDKLNCSAGDDVEYHLDGDQIRILVCRLNSSGVAADRSSKYSFWQETLTPEELGRKVSKYLDVGEIVDLQPLSYGVSRRVYEMKVVGTKTSGVVKGIRVRWALGLRDNLFVIDRVFGSNGAVKQFVFTGRGWGHGLGMCQVGAIGYARQGKDYRFILKHYYSGVEITRLR